MWAVVVSLASRHCFQSVAYIINCAAPWHARVGGGESPPLSGLDYSSHKVGPCRMEMGNRQNPILHLGRQPAPVISSRIREQDI